jgi:hypothetical protein
LTSGLRRWLLIPKTFELNIFRAGGECEIDDNDDKADYNDDGDSITNDK